MASTLQAATFAWRLTVEGAEAITKAFSDIGKAANTNMKGTAAASGAASTALAGLTNQLGGMVKRVDELEKLRRQIIMIAGISGVGLLVKNSLEAAASVKKMAGEAGFAIVPYQELVYALRQFNVEKETAATAMRKFSQETAHFVTHNAGSAKDAYQTLFGADAQKIAQQGLANVDQFFLQVLARIGGLKSEAQKLDLLRAMFGRDAGPQLIEAANAGTAAIKRQMETAQRLGIVFSVDMVEKADRAQDEIANLTDILSKKLAIAINENADELARLAEIGIENLPTVLKLFEGIADIAGFIRDSFAAISISFQNIGQVASNAGDWLTSHDLFGRRMPGKPGASPGLLDGVADPMMAFGGQDQSAANGGLHITVGNPAGMTGGAAPPIGDDAAVKKAEALASAYEKLTFNLKEEIAAMGTSSREMFISNEQRKLGAQATQEQRDAIAELAGTLFDEKKAWDSVKSASESAGQAASKALQDAITKGGEFSDVLKGLGQTLLDIAYKFLIGDPLSQGFSGLLQGVFGKSSSSSTGGGLFSSIASFFGGGKAEGGPLDPGKWYIAGEYGPEPIWGGGPGAFAAGYGSGSGGKSGAVSNTYYIDAQGADQAAITRLEASLSALHGSIEKRALHAVFSETRRNPAFIG